MQDMIYHSRYLNHLHVKFIRNFLKKNVVNIVVTADWFNVIHTKRCENTEPFMSNKTHFLYRPLFHSFFLSFFIHLFFLSLSLLFLFDKSKCFVNCDQRSNLSRTELLHFREFVSNHTLVKWTNCKVQFEIGRVFFAYWIFKSPVSE